MEEERMSYEEEEEEGEGSYIATLLYNEFPIKNNNSL